MAAVEKAINGDPLFAPKEVAITYKSDGTLLLRSPIAPCTYERHLCCYLQKWSQEAPHRTFLAQRGTDGEWRRLSYAEAWNASRAIGQALLDRGLSSDRPIAILSGNSIEHALVTLGAMMAGVPAAPISPTYSLSADGLVRLREVVDLLRPAMVFVQDTKGFSGARALPALAEIEWVTAIAENDATPLSELTATKPSSTVDEAFLAANGDTVAKILFTSGSTGSPKGVIQTQRMLCSSVARSSLVLYSLEAPVQVDWMPWHHTMGGNTTIGTVLRSGGSLHIDDGRPTAQLFAETIRNLREISVTTAQNVPAGYQLLVEAMEEDEGLRKSFFKRLSRISYAGASLPRNVWERLQSLAEQTIGRQVPIVSGYGTTETGPGVSVAHWASDGRGEIGLPIPGVEIKLVPFGDRYEIRVKGPNVSPGYLRRPDLTAKAFDDEGFFIIGDAVTFVDPIRPNLGLRFAGRLSENFKLTNGSWVLTGELRAAVMAKAPSLAEVVVAGQDRSDIRLLVWAAPSLRNALKDQTSDPIAVEQTIAETIRAELNVHNLANSGATRRIAAFRVMRQAPSLAAGETTDKGYVNQRAVLSNNGAVVEDLYCASPSTEVHFCP